MIAIEKLIRQFDLQPHPEGGWYRQTYKSNELISKQALPGRFAGDRSFSTAIYFLLAKGDFSGFHKIKSDECWHYYAGDPLELYIIDESGNLKVIVLGNNVDKGHHFQYVVPANCWFASRPAPESAYAFVGCTVAPGFEFEDLELANARSLSSSYPKHTTIIHQLCRL